MYSKDFNFIKTVYEVFDNPSYLKCSIEPICKIYFILYTFLDNDIFLLSLVNITIRSFKNQVQIWNMCIFGVLNTHNDKGIQSNINHDIKRGITMILSHFPIFCCNFHLISYRKDLSARLCYCVSVLKTLCNVRVMALSGHHMFVPRRRYVQII